jgi:hypothetical protein
MVVVPLDEFDIDEISKVLQALEETKNIKEGKKSHFVSRMI